MTVSWTAPEGGLTGYKLGLYSSDNSPVSDEKTVLKDKEKTLVFGSADNVKSGTIYTVKIFAYIVDSGNEIKSTEINKEVTTGMIERKYGFYIINTIVFCSSCVAILDTVSENKVYFVWF